MSNNANITLEGITLYLNWKPEEAHSSVEQTFMFEDGKAIIHLKTNYHKDEYIDWINAHKEELEAVLKYPLEVRMILPTQFN